MTLSFFVPGLARPKGSKRAFALRQKSGGYTGRVALVESAGAGLKAWEQQIRVEAGRKMARSTLLDGPILCDLTFTLIKPKALAKKLIVAPTKRPDLDKLARSCLDAMTGIVFRDDSQVVELTLKKCYGDPPGVQVQITVA